MARKSIYRWNWTKVSAILREVISTSVLLQQYQMLCFWTNYRGSPLLHFHGRNQQVYIVDRTMWRNIRGGGTFVAFPWKCFLSIHIVDSSSGYTNATQCYVMCTLPVLLTCGICKILQEYYKIYWISVQLTNILLEFMTLQPAGWIYTLSLSVVACVKKGGKDRQWHSCSQWGNTNHNIDVIWCLSFTAETPDLLYQYCVERCVLSEVELKQLS